VVSPTALRIRRFLRDKQCVAPVVSAILKINDWAESIQAGRCEFASGNFETPVPACALLQQIGEDLVDNGTGIEHQLLSKSLQETLFSCLGFDTDLTSTQIKTRLKRFLDRHTRAVFIQRFLSLYFFNCVWFRAVESFTGQAISSQVFEKDMEELDRICKRAVTGVYDRIEVLNESAAEELIRNIEERLAWCCHAASHRNHSAVQQTGRGIQRSRRLESSRRAIGRISSL